MIVVHAGTERRPVGEGPAPARRTRRVIVVGAGPGGLCAAIRLLEAGYEDVVVLERADGVGGTWYHNRYPGAACDVQTHLYSLSFAPKPDWPRPYAPQPEIRAYLEQLVDRYGLAPHLRLGTGVRAAHWDDDRDVWRVVTEAGEELEADVLVGAVGMFNEIHRPDIPGLDDFAGTVFHSARWDEDHDLTGERVAVIGAAASAVQLVPEVAKVAARVHVFQRAASWVLPKEDMPFTEEQLDEFRAAPDVVARRRREIRDRMDLGITFSNPETLRQSEAAGLANLAVVRDPDVRRRLTPTDPFGCRRPLLSNDYYPTFNLPHVELVTDPIERVTPDAVVTADGVERPVDTIVLATGFETTKYLSTIEVTGRGGVSLDEVWRDGAQAYLGITVAGFPNLFMLYGPNTNNGSILTMIEAQVEYLVRHVEWIDVDDLAWIDVRPDVMAAYNEELQRDLDAVEVWQAGCHGYYRGPSGRIVTQWPHTMAEYRARTERPDVDAYEVTARARSG